MRRSWCSVPLNSALVAGASAERDRESDRRHDIVLELAVATAEVSAVKVVLDVEAKGGVPALAQREAEAHAGVAAELRAARIVVEGILSPRDQGGAGADVE